MKQLRQAILSEVEVVAAKPRFGLFSQPPPIAVGDNSFFSAKKANKGEDGKPKTKPRNMLGGANRTGNGKRSYIQVPQSIYQKDPYKDPFKISMEYQRKLHGKSSLHEGVFRPSSGVKTIATPSYTYTEEQEQRKIKIRKDENGRVKTEPSNVITNPTSKIQNKLFRHVQHMRDQYDRKKWIENQQRQVWRSKLKGETMFKSMSHGCNFFSKEKAVFGMDDHAKMMLSRKKPFKLGNYKRVHHETKFKLARRGHGDPIGRYPQFIQTNGRVKTEYSLRRQNTSKSQSEKELWRPTSGTLSRPTPSITFMPTNIRKCVR